MVNSSSTSSMPSSWHQCATCGWTGVNPCPQHYHLWNSTATLQASVEPVEALISQLNDSIRAWDSAYLKAVAYWPAGERMTEELLKVKVRQHLRADGVELPEILRWRLRSKIGYRAEED